MSIDHRTLLADAYQVWVRYPEEVRGMSFQDILLATRIPGLPIEATFADLLRWGENVARGDSALTLLHAMDGTPVPDKYGMTGRDLEVLANACLAALRTGADR